MGFQSSSCLISTSGSQLQPWSWEGRTPARRTCLWTQSWLWSSHAALPRTCWTWEARLVWSCRGWWRWRRTRGWGGGGARHSPGGQCWELVEKQEYCPHLLCSQPGDLDWALWVIWNNGECREHDWNVNCFWNYYWDFRADKTDWYDCMICFRKTLKPDLIRYLKQPFLKNFPAGRKIY